jgi:hypothetical protein
MPRPVSPQRTPMPAREAAIRDCALVVRWASCVVPVQPKLGPMTFCFCPLVPGRGFSSGIASFGSLYYISALIWRLRVHYRCVSDSMSWFFTTNSTVHRPHCLFAQTQLMFTEYASNDRVITVAAPFQVSFRTCVVIKLAYGLLVWSCNHSTFMVVLVSVPSVCSATISVWSVHDL